MKSFKQYLKEYASKDDQELANTLTRVGEGGQALRDAMIQGGLLPTGSEDEDDHPQVRDILQRRDNRIAGILDDIPVERQEALERRYRQRANKEIDKYWSDVYDQKSKQMAPDAAQNDPSFVEKRKVPSETDNTEGEDQKMLDTIAGSNEWGSFAWYFDHPNQRDAGSALLSAMRAGGMTFDAKWPSNVDRYDNREKDAGRMRPVSTERR